MARDPFPMIAMLLMQHHVAITGTGSLLLLPTTTVVTLAALLRTRSNLDACR